MYAQLGTTIFDGAKSFVTFSKDDEPIIAEHATIGRKSKLQGIRQGLSNISISLFLHQEFCVVKDEIAKLYASANNFEILPLLWGNGQVEGYFVISRISQTKAQMDGLGNTYAAVMDVALIESIDGYNLNQQQLQAKKDAFATGSKQPAQKSTRTNPTPCDNGVAKNMSIISTNGHLVDVLIKSYTIKNVNNPKTLNALVNVKSEATLLRDKTTNSDFPCIFGNTGATNNAGLVIETSNALGTVIVNNDASPDTAAIDAVKQYNTLLQTQISALKKSVSSNLKKSVIGK